MIRSFLSFVAVVVCVSTGTQARDLYVGSKSGKFSTIQAAVDVAVPGDVIHLDPELSPYRESAAFYNKSGEPGKPIILDGHGSTLLGSERVDPTQWEDQGDGLWRSRALAVQLNMRASIIGRFFFVFNGKPQYMGGASKSKSPNLKQPSELLLREWTYVQDENAFYIRIESGRSIADAAVEVPVRSAGVIMRGNSAYLVVRNIAARHVWNDGFNIHGQCTNIVFENIESIECGDDGISAHGQCEIMVNGFVSRGNANGICHVNESRSVNRNVHIMGSRSYDLYLLNESKHELEDVVIEASGPRGVVLTAGTQVHMDRVTIKSEAEVVNVHVDREASCSFDHSTFWNTQMTVQKASVIMNHSAFGGPKALLTLIQPRGWQAANNTWNVEQFVYNEKKISGADLAGFRELTGQDEGSEVRQFTLEDLVR